MAAESAPHVIVVGGGVIGLSSAYHLARAGHRVTVIERGRCGHGASWGNAGWITPSLVQPFNAPGAVPGAVRAMFDPASPIAIRQLPTWALARWGWSFLRNSRADRSQDSLRALATAAAGAAADVATLASELDFEVHRSGLLVAFRSADALAAYRISHAQVQAAGYQGQAIELGPAETKDHEPALADDVVGGLYLPDEVSVRPDAMTAALARGVTAAGGEIAEQESVRTATPGPHGWRVQTALRELSAAAVVLAAGERTTRLARACGARVVLQSARGCSVTLPPVLELQGPLKIAEHRVACTPFENGQVRISGTFDLVRIGAGTDRRRMQAVLDAAATTLPAVADLDIADLDVWSGARPCTPDSVPVIGPIGRNRGLFVATGHGTLGMTLAVPTARAVTEMVNTILGQTI